MTAFAKPEVELEGALAGISRQFRQRAVCVRAGALQRPHQVSVIDSGDAGRFGVDGYIK
jgi:hypothetical protein